MAKSKSKTSPPTRFTVRIPGYSGMHPVGIRFMDNVGHTEDPAIADAAREMGLEVSSAPSDESADEAAESNA